MLRIAALTALIAALPACNTASRHTSDHHIAPTTALGVIEGRPTLGMPITIPGRDACIVPFSVEERKGLFDDRDPYSRANAHRVVPTSYNPLPGGPVRWHNAVVHDLATGEDWPILNSRGVINHVQVYGDPGNHAERAPITHAILFLAAVEDTNRDGRLDQLDANVAILTDADGRNPREVTPRDAQVWNTHYEITERVLYLQVVADTNDDGRFSTSDAPSPIVIRLNNGAPAPLVSESTKATIQAHLQQ